MAAVATITAAILKIYFSLLLLNRKANDSKLGRKHQGDLLIKKKLKSFRSEIQDGCHGGHLENLFFASSPEPKGQLTRNFVGSIRETCRSKIAIFFSDRKSKMAATAANLKICFSLLLMNQNST